MGCLCDSTQQDQITLAWNFPQISHLMQTQIQ